MGGTARPARDLIGRSSVAAGTGLGLIVLLVACSSETLGPHGGLVGSGGTGNHPTGSGGSNGGGGDAGTGGTGGDFGGAGGDGAIGGTGGEFGGGGSVGAICVQSSQCGVGFYCYLGGCNANYGNCRALGTDASGTCDPTIGPVCGCDGKQYANECAAYDNGTSALGGACPAVVGTPCPAGNPNVCGIGEYCQLASCDDVTGGCQTMPDGATCTASTGIVCGCDGTLYDSDCTAAGIGISIRNVGACPPLPSGPCSSQDDCGGASYANQVVCVPSGCNSPAGTCTRVSDLCIPILLAGGGTTSVCGCDGQTYGDACTAHMAGITVAHQGACETP